MRTFMGVGTNERRATRRRARVPVWVFAGLLVACGTGSRGAPARADLDGGPSPGEPDASPVGTTAEFGDAASLDGSKGPASTELVASIRDFKLYDPGDPTTNPDFENVPRTDQNGNPSTTYTGPWDDPAIVTDRLGADGKPVYASATGKTLTTHGRAAFDAWFRDVPGTNVRVEYPIVLAQSSGGSYEYDSEKTGTQFSGSEPQRMFFPIDDGTKYATAFGNQAKPHNYGFTVELHTTFTYQGGEYFKFRGDDDVFVYIDGRRVINLGGIHGPNPAEIQVDTMGLVRGQDYPLDFFAAERHVYGSNILFTTTLELRPAPR